jgi:urate oxidase
MAYNTLEKLPEPVPDSEFEFVDAGYGKNYVKMLHIRRDGPTHYIKELSVNTHLSLDSKKDYYFGDNSDIVATDSQKNTVYVLAKLHGVKSPEEFGLLLCSHFLSKYPHVIKVSVCLEEHPWERMIAGTTPHNHAFISTPSATRFASIIFRRGGKLRQQRSFVLSVKVKLLRKLLTE